jgi:hypothetical protein
MLKKTTLSILDFLIKRQPAVIVRDLKKVSTGMNFALSMCTTVIGVKIAVRFPMMRRFETVSSRTGYTECA